MTCRYTVKYYNLPSSHAKTIYMVFTNILLQFAGCYAIYMCCIVVLVPRFAGSHTICVVDMVSQFAGKFSFLFNLIYKVMQIL